MGVPLISLGSLYTCNPFANAKVSERCAAISTDADQQQADMTSSRSASNAMQMLSGARIASKLDPSPFGSAAQTERIDARHAWRPSGDRVQNNACDVWPRRRAPVLLEHSAAPWSRRKRKSCLVEDSTGRSRVYGTISHTLYLIPNGPSTTVGPAECTWAHLYTSWVRCG